MQESITSYPVHERFYTFQGEGLHMGKPAFFIRLFGCPVRCPWCDSAGTWHPGWIPRLPDKVKKMTALELKAEVDATNAEIVVVTGGEPTIHNLRQLTYLFTGELVLDGPHIHLETSGAFEILGDFHFVTLSPKKWKYPLAENVRVHASEFKFIIETPEDIKFYTDMVGDLGYDYHPERPIWLHPEWSHHESPKVLRAIADAVKGGERPYRAGWQLHKLYKVDGADDRSRPLVPLGGEMARGY